MSSYLIKDCSTNDVEVIASNDLSGYLGKVVRLAGMPGYCGIVQEVIPTDLKAIPVQVLECFKDCEECNQDFFKLESCDGTFEDVYSTNSSLLTVNNKIVKVPYFRDSCFKVTKEDYTGKIENYPELSFEGNYSNCVDCYPQQKASNVNPYENFEDPKVVKLKTDFAEEVYKSVIARKFGIKYCCNKDLSLLRLRNYLLNFKLIFSKTPDPKEPKVLEECLCIKRSHTRCCQGHEEVHNPKCIASVDSPHDCHNYAVSILPASLALAFGNTETDKDGQIFFGYYKCKDTEVTTVAFSQERQETFCVLGIPVLGYYQENKWYELVITRGEICLPQEIKKCCNG